MDNQEEILRLVKEADPDNPLQYVHDIVKGYAHEKSNSYISQCNDCSICNGSKTLTSGNPNATVLVIGESAPGEDYSGNIIPIFSKEEQRIIDTVFDTLHVNKDQIFYINAVNCWPCKQLGNETVKRTPYKKEVENCSVFVDYAIKLVQPLVIILLGGIALNLFEKESISNARGKWIEVKGIPAIPTYHPGYFEKVEGHKDPDTIENQKLEFVDDIRHAFMYIQENYPDTNTLLEPIE
jgi:DNA polymerase